MGGASQIAQKWLAGLIGLGALFVVASHPDSIAKLLNAGQKFISGTERTATTGKA